MTTTSTIGGLTDPMTYESLMNAINAFKSKENIASRIEMREHFLKKVTDNVGVWIQDESMSKGNFYCGLPVLINDYLPEGVLARFVSNTGKILAEVTE